MSVTAALSAMSRAIQEPVGAEMMDAIAAGEPVVGYLCHYVPTEVLLAAGALPLRLRGVGCEDSAEGDAFMSGRVCTFVRHVVTHALEGRFDELTGVVSTNCCDHVRRATDLFVKKVGLPFTGFVSIPRTPRESLYPYYRDQLRQLLRELTEATGRGGTDDDLRRAIETINGVRERLIRVDEARRGEVRRLTGAEALTVHVVSQVLPPGDFCRLADDLLEHLETRDPLDDPRARVVLVGAALDEPAYVRALESQGAAVVADRLCFGARSVLRPLAVDVADPLDVIARSYFFRPSCARMIGDFPARWQAILDQVEQVDADGVVFERLLFCDPWGADQHNSIERSGRGEGPPMLVLEREYGIVPTGQVRTRVQAFVEKLEIDRAQRRARGGAR